LTKHRAPWPTTTHGAAAAGYIPRTQRVGRVDISGFEYPGTGVITLGDEAFGGVKQQLDFTGDEEATLENFINVLYHMTSLPPVESRTRSARGTGEIPTNTNESGPRRAGRPSMTDIIEDEKYIQARARTAAELANITKPVIRRRMAHSAR